eukprot:359441-Chlamydomonas_euryale.AAC.9
MLQLWTDQPPSAEWITRGQPAHTQSPRPPGAEERKAQGPLKGQKRQKTDTRDAGRKGDGRQEARSKEGRKKTGVDWKGGESEDKKGARAQEDETRQAEPKPQIPAPQQGTATPKALRKGERRRSTGTLPADAGRQIGPRQGPHAGGDDGRTQGQRTARLGGRGSGVPMEGAGRDGARQRAALAKTHGQWRFWPVLAGFGFGRGGGGGGLFAGRGSGGSRPPPLADAPEHQRASHGAHPRASHGEHPRASHGAPDPQHACPSALHPAAQPGRGPRPGRPPERLALDAETLPAHR